MKFAKTTPVEYTISMPAPGTHLFHVKILFKQLPKNGKLVLKMPAWRSGRYFIFDFAGGVQEFSAVNEKNNTLAWQKTDKLTWQIDTKGKEVTVEYKVFGNEFLQRTRGLDTEHAFINNTAVFMFSPLLYKKQLTLKVVPFENWHVTTGMERVENDENKFYAPNYDYFADCPLEIGTQDDFSFDVNGIKHTVSIFGNANYDKERLIKDFTTIIKKNFEFWGKVPYEHYTFIVHCTPQSGGGTEHINSTVVGVRPQQFESEEGYTNFLRLISHEFFHTWNVKQLKPAGLTPYDWTRENYTSELWIAEGATSYYDGLMLLRTGQMTRDDFYKEITKGAEDERRRPGNLIQSAAESSFDAWIKFWKRSQNSYNSESDYYAKGSYVCLVLDLEIMHSSGAKHYLDDVMKYMFNKYPLDVKGYTNEDFRRACEKYASTSLKQFFADYVYGTKPVEWERYLEYAGLELLRSDEVIKPVAGLFCHKNGEKIIVQEVLAGSSAERAKIMPGDEIIAMDGVKLTYDEAERKITALKKGDKVKLSLFRAEKLMEHIISMEELNITNYSLRPVENPNKLQQEIFAKWVG